MQNNRKHNKAALQIHQPDDKLNHIMFTFLLISTLTMDLRVIPGNIVAADVLRRQ